MLGRRTALVLALAMVIPPGLTGAGAGQTASVDGGPPLQAADDHTFWPVLESAYETPATAASAINQDADGNGAVDYLDRLSRLAGETGHASVPVEILAWYDHAPSRTDADLLEARDDVRSAEQVPGLDALFTVAAAGSTPELVDERGVEQVTWSPRAAPQTHADGDDRTGNGPPAEGERTEALNASLAWRMGATGDGITIGIADTGIDTSLEGFAGKQIRWFDAIDGTSSPFDPDGHGTRVARLAASAHGGAAPDADLAVARVMTGEDGTIADLAEGLAWFEEIGVDVVLLPFTTRGPRIGGVYASFQGPMNGGESDRLGWDRLVAPFAQQVPTIAAAGNVDLTVIGQTIGEGLGVLSWQSGAPVGVNGVNQVGSPGYTCSTITVGMVNEWYTHQPRSAAGPGRVSPQIDGPCPIKPDLVTRTLHGYREPADATSEAAAVIGGATAALLSHAGDLGPEEVRTTLTSTARAPPVKPGGEGLPRPNTATGYGIPDLTEAVKQHPPVDPGLTQTTATCWTDACTVDAVTNAPAKIEALIDGHVVGTSEGRVHELALPAGTDEVTLRASGDTFSDEQTLTTSIQTQPAAREVTLYGQLRDNDPRSPEHMELSTFGPSHTSFPMQAAPAPVGPDVVGFDLTPPAARGLHLGSDATAFVHLGTTSTGQTHLPGALLVNVSARLMDGHGVLGETSKTVLLTNTKRTPGGDNAQEVRLPFTLDRTRTSSDGDLRLELDWTLPGGVDPSAAVVMWGRYDHPNGITLEVQNLEHSTSTTEPINDQVRLVKGQLSTVFGSVFVDPDTFTATGTDGLQDARIDSLFNILQDTWFAVVQDPSGGTGTLELNANTRQGNPVSASVPLDLPGASEGPGLAIEAPEEVATDRPIPITVTSDTDTDQVPTIVGDWFPDPVTLERTSARTFEGTLPAIEPIHLDTRDRRVLATLEGTVEEASVHIADFRDPYVSITDTPFLKPVPLPGGPTLVRWDPTTVNDDNEVPEVELRVGSHTFRTANDGSAPLDVPPGETRSVELRYIDAYERVTKWQGPAIVPGIHATTSDLAPVNGTTQTVPIRVSGSVAPAGLAPSGAKRVAEANCPEPVSEQSNGFPCMAAAMAEPGMVTFQLADFSYTISPTSLDAQPSRPTLIRLDVWDQEDQKTALLAYNSVTSQLRPAGRVPGLGIDAWGWIAGGANTLVIGVPAHELEGSIEDTHVEFLTPGAAIQPMPLTSLNKTIDPLPAPPETDGTGEIHDGWVAQSGGHLVTMLNTTEAAQGSRIDATIDVVRGEEVHPVTVSGVVGGGAIEGPGELRSGTHHHVLRVPLLALLGGADDATVAGVQVRLDDGAAGRLDWSGPLALDMDHLDARRVQDEGCPAVQRSLLAPWGALMLAQTATSLCETTYTAQMEATVHDIVEHEVDDQVSNGDHPESARHTIAMAADRAITAPTQFTVSTFGGGTVGVSGDSAILETRMRAHTVIDHMDAQTPYSVNATLDRVRVQPPETGHVDTVAEERVVELGPKTRLPAADAGPGVPQVRIASDGFQETVFAPGGQIDRILPIDAPGHAPVTLDLTVQGTAAVPVTEQREITLNHRPSVDATVTTTDPITLEPVEATADATDPDGDPLSLTWLVDGVAVDTGPTLSWTPSEPGPHTLTVRAEDPWSSVETEEIVDVENRPPTVTVSPQDVTIARNTVLSLDAEASDPDDGIGTIEWRIDGEPAGEGATLERVWTDPGTHTVTVEATDLSGATAIATTNVTVTNAAPSVELGSDGTVRVKTLTEVVVNLTTSDAEGDDLSASIVSGPADATVEPITDGFQMRWTPTAPGTYEIVIAVDDGAKTNRTQVTVEALNRAPVVHAIDAPASIKTLSLASVEADATDLDGQITDWRWYLNGERTDDTGPQAFLSFPTPGEHQVKVIVEDDQGATAQASTTLEALNRAPSITESVSLAGPAPALEQEPIRLTAEAKDPDGPAATVTVLVDGSAVATGTRQVQTTLHLAEGTHTLAIEATDVHGATETRSRTIEVAANQAPIAAAQLPTLEAPGEARWISNATDPEHRPVDHTWSLDGLVVASGQETVYRADQAGTFDVTLTVTDPSGGTDTVTEPFVVDDGLDLQGRILETAGSPVLILEMDRLGVDAAPTGRLNVTWGPAGLPLWSHTETVDDAWTVIRLDRLAEGIEHEISATWTAGSAPGAPIQDTEQADLVRTY